MCRVLTDPCIEEHQTGSAFFKGLPLGRALIQRFISLKFMSKWARVLGYAYEALVYWKGAKKNGGEKSVFADFSWFVKVKRNAVSGILSCPSNEPGSALSTISILESILK